MQSTGNVKEKTADAVSFIRPRLQHPPRIGIVLGSGLKGLADDFRHPVKIPLADIPHFPVPSVKGHGGHLVAGRLGDVPIISLAGRVHYYEGYDMETVAFPMRVLAGLGIDIVIVTNAAGAVNQRFSPGDFVAITDHINFMGMNPLRGTTDFIDLSEAYDGDLLKSAGQSAESEGILLHAGVYAYFYGPSFETPAEIRAMGILGADIVGMSTVPEVIMARRLGVRVLGLSMVSNMAAGISPNPLSHAEVIEMSNQRGKQFQQLVKRIVTDISSRGNP